jgi:K+-transporting ATPase KdpF subunit
LAWSGCASASREGGLVVAIYWVGGIIAILLLIYLLVALLKPEAF